MILAIFNIGELPEIGDVIPTPRSPVKDYSDVDIKLKGITQSSNNDANIHKTQYTLS